MPGPWATEDGRHHMEHASTTASTTNAFGTNQENTEHSLQQHYSRRVEVANTMQAGLETEPLQPADTQSGEQRPVVEQEDIIEQEDLVLSNFENGLRKFEVLDEKGYASLAIQLNVNIDTLKKRLELRLSKVGSDIASALSTPAKQRQVLTRLDPPIPQRAGASFAALRPSRDLQQQQHPTMLCGHVNVETLTKDSNLLHLLFSRSTTPAHETAAAIYLSADLDQNSVEFQGRPQDPVMGLTAQTYGLISTLSRVQKASIAGVKTPWTSNAIIVSAAAGIAMMRMQVEELGILLNVTEVALAGGISLNDGALMANKFPEPMTMPSDSFDDGPTLLNITDRLLCKHSKDADLATLASHISAHLDQAVDHIKQLQLDPVYLSDGLRDQMQHFRYRIQDDLVGKVNVSPGQMGTYFMLQDAYKHVLYLNVIKKTIGDASVLRERDRSAWDKCDLSRDCIRVFNELEIALGAYIEHLIPNLGFAVASLGIMQDAYQNSPKTVHTTDQWDLATAILKEDAVPEKAYLHRVFKTLCIQKHMLRHSLWPVIREAQFAVDRDVAGNQYLSEWVLQQFSRLAAICELWRQLKSLQPQATWWSQTRSPEATEHTRAVLVAADSIDNVLWRYCTAEGFAEDEPVFVNLEVDDDQLGQRKVEAEYRLDKFFSPLYVVLDHTQGHIMRGRAPHMWRKAFETTDEVGLGLHGFDFEAVFKELCDLKYWWLGADRAYKYDVSTDACLSMLEEDDWKLPSTPLTPSVDLNEGGDEAIEPPSAPGISKNDVQPEPVPVQPDFREVIATERPTPSSSTEAITSDKPRRYAGTHIQSRKRRRDAGPADRESAADTQTTRRISNTFKGTIEVDARAYEAFQVMDVVPGQSRGNLPWVDLLHAMKQAGFSAQRAAILGWKFEGHGKSMLLHEPHPGKKLVRKQAQNVGKRLKVNYGFRSDTIKLE